MAERTFTPTPKRIVFTNIGGKRDGRASVILTCMEDMIPGSDLQLFLYDVASRMVPEGCPWSIVDTDKIPADPDFRSARTFDHATGTFGHDMEKARKIHRDRIREARKPLLEAEDIEVSAALAMGDQPRARAAEIERQRLRDITKHKPIDDAKTVADLRDPKAWPL